jgi:hypothetical protein
MSFKRIKNSTYFILQNPARAKPTHLRKYDVGKYCKLKLKILIGIMIAFETLRYPNLSKTGVANILARKPINHSWPINAIEVSDQQLISWTAPVIPKM